MVLGNMHDRSAGTGQNKGTVFKIASTILLPKVGEMSYAFQLMLFTFSCFMNSYKFRGYQNYTTTITTEHLLSVKILLFRKNNSINIQREMN